MENTFSTTFSNPLYPMEKVLSTLWFRHSLHRAMDFRIQPSEGIPRPREKQEDGGSCQTCPYNIVFRFYFLYFFLMDGFYFLYLYFCISINKILHHPSNNSIITTKTTIIKSGSIHMTKWIQWDGISRKDEN